MLTLILVLLTNLRAETMMGRDEFGRACRLEFSPNFAVQIEDEWFEKPTAVRMKQEPGPNGVAAFSGNLTSRVDQGYAEFTMVVRENRVAWFTLRLPSATYYEHICRLQLTH